MWNRPGSQYVPNVEQAARIEARVDLLRERALTLAAEPIALHDLLIRLGEFDSDRAYVSRALADLQSRDMLTMSPTRVVTATAA